MVYHWMAGHGTGRIEHQEHGEAHFHTAWRKRHVLLILATFFPICCVSFPHLCFSGPWIATVVPPVGLFSSWNTVSEHKGKQRHTACQYTLSGTGKCKHWKRPSDLTDKSIPDCHVIRSGDFFVKCGWFSGVKWTKDHPKTSKKSMRYYQVQVIKYQVIKETHEGRCTNAFASVTGFISSQPAPRNVGWLCTNQLHILKTAFRFRHNAGCAFPTYAYAFMGGSWEKWEFYAKGKLREAKKASVLLICALLKTAFSFICFFRSYHLLYTSSTSLCVAATALICYSHPNRYSIFWVGVEWGPCIISFRLMTPH